ncbi:MAG: hypothetical protein GQ549_05665 [Gammaproteobacteria bacterium]|nr:hypothetical protein [Gammaproteobacteria bacterium]
MKIFVISLSDAVERRKNAKEQLDKTGLEFTFFDALTGKNGFSEHFSAYDEYQYLLDTGRKATACEIGCYASHLALWKTCVDLNEPIMIMEDDFLLKENFVDAFHESEKLIADYGFIRLQREHRCKRKFVKHSGEFTLLYYTKMPHCLMCYVISPAVAKAFIRSSSTLTAPVDVMIKKIWQHKQRLYGLSPYPVVEDKLSEITCIPGRVKNKKSLKVQVMRIVTKITWIVKRILFTYNFKPPA